MFLCIVIDLYSRMFLSFRLSNTGDADLSCETMRYALSHHGTPQLFHSDKGSTYSAGKCQALLRHNSIVASMTGERGWKDNPIAERFFASIKGECTELFEFADGEEARAGIGNWQMKYNYVRPHMSLSQRTPANVYLGNEKIISCGARNLTVSERARELFDSFFIS